MKKITVYAVLFLFAVWVVVSCIQKEPLNVEADIISCRLPDNDLVVKGVPVIENSSVMILVINNDDLIDLSAVPLELTVSKGARIEPVSGTVRDFHTAQEYTVTSEDGEWTKEYSVAIIDSDIPVKYGFENWERQGKYEIPYEIGRDDGNNVKMRIWSSGNGGYSLTGQADSPSDFPTSPTEDSHSGARAARLVTRSTGSFGAMAGMRLAAGNLFIGTFDSSQTTSNALGATRFGIPFDKIPVRLEGYYKYAPGEKYQDFHGNHLPGVTDACSIYAIFYERGPGGETLDGSNALSAPNLIMTAEVKPEDLSPTSQYRFFSADFKLVGGRSVDMQKLADFKYNIAIVCSSSVNGAMFSGAIGSTLCVDDLKIVLPE